MAFLEGLFSEGLNTFGNVANGYIAKMFQDQYMGDWGSPEAQMRSFAKAGINPYFAAQQISGNSGNSNVQAAQTSPDLTGSVEGMSNVEVNEVTKPNVEADTANKNEDTKSKQMDNEIKQDTLDSQKQAIRDNARKLGADADTAEIIAQYQDVLSNATIDELVARADSLDAEARLKSKQLLLVDKEMEQIDEDIKKIKQEVKTLMSQEDLNRAHEAQSQKEREKLEKEIERQQIENEIAEEGMSSDPVGQYRRLRKKHGKWYADQWLEKTYKINEELKESETQGEVNVTYGRSGVVGTSIDAIRRVFGDKDDMFGNALFEIPNAIGTEDGWIMLIDDAKKTDRSIVSSYENFEKYVDSVVSGLIKDYRAAYDADKLSYRDYNKAVQTIYNNANRVKNKNFYSRVKGR